VSEVGASVIPDGESSPGQIRKIKNTEEYLLKILMAHDEKFKKKTKKLKNGHKRPQVDEFSQPREFYGNSLAEDQLKF
jgi:hypothetical protein